MKNSPLIFGVVALLCLSPVYADCSIDGDWTKSEYDGGQTMRFEGSISPTSGFIRAEIINPIDDVVYEIDERQIEEDFEVEFETDDTFLSGTYKVRVYYTELANGTECGETYVSSTNLDTDNDKGDVIFNITLEQSLGNIKTTHLSGAPIQTQLGQIDTEIDVSAVEGLAPSFKIDGVQLIPGTNLGDIDLHFTQCQKNQDILNSYNDVSNFLKSNYTDVLTFQLENERLKSENNRYFSDQQELNRRISNLTGQTEQWKATAGAKVDSWIIFIIGVPLGIILLLIIQAIGRRQLGPGEEISPVKPKERIVMQE